jgi:hypothetical protein
MAGPTKCTKFGVRQYNATSESNLKLLVHLNFIYTTSSLLVTEAEFHTIHQPSITG